LQAREGTAEAITAERATITAGNKALNRGIVERLG